MIGALLYLQFTSFKNAVRQRVLRLRQPRYLFGALAGTIYFYFFIIRHFFTHARPVAVKSFSLDPTTAGPLIEPVAAFVLFTVFAFSWVLPSGRAALTFSEAEAAFLFPAPIARRSLIHFKLIRSQITLLFTGLVFSLLTNRWAFLGGSLATHALGWWLIFSCLNLHVIAASFTCDRLTTAGITAPRRRCLILALVVAISVVSAHWIRGNLPTPAGADLTDLASFLSYVGTALQVGPLPWLLSPFRMLVRPFLANDVTSFFRALSPVLLLGAVHYLWVIRSEVAFEEASLVAAQKRAERRSALRSGRWSSRPASAAARREPFRLSPLGSPTLAFLWTNLISVGPWYYPRSWLIFAVVLVSGQNWLLSHHQYRNLAEMTGVGAAAIGAYALLLGPILVRRGAQRLVERLDAMKAYPLRGWEIILGELSSPVLLLSMSEWILITLLALAAGNGAMHQAFSPLLATTSAVGLAMIIPPLAGMLFGLNFVGILYFPSWTVSNTPGGGIEKGGQRLIFLAGYTVVLLLCLVPALGLGALVLLVTHLFSDSLPLSIGATALTAAAVLAAEFAAMVWWLGNRYEHFDISSELPR